MSSFSFTVTTRDGKSEKFNPAKITAAILKAGEETKEFGMQEAENITLDVTNLLMSGGKSDYTVEEIQDFVEQELMDSKFRKTAKAFIIYRDQHHRLRHIVSSASVDLVDQYLSQMDWRVNENSNMGFSLQGLNSYISAEVSKTYWLGKIYPSSIRKSHYNGDFHIHDLGYISAVVS